MISVSKRLQIVVLAAGVLMPLVAGCGAVLWEHRYQTGIKKASTQRRRALVQFHSGLNADCREMDLEVFSDPEIQELMGKYIPIRLDYSLNKKLAKEFGVQVVPTFIVVRPDMTIAGSRSGKMDINTFRVFLIKYVYD